jgi:uncharacterized protein YggU (UPF0235/DUF167 family)
LILHLRAKPNAKANALQRASDGSLVVRLKAPAHDGKANACLLAFLAQEFGISKSSVLLLSGHTAPYKKVELLGVDEAAAQAVLARHTPE